MFGSFGGGSSKGSGGSSNSGGSNSSGNNSVCRGQDFFTTNDGERGICFYAPKSNSGNGGSGSYPSGTGSSGREGRGGGSSKSGRDHYESKTQERFADFSGHLGLNSSGQCNVSKLFFSRSISVENVTSLSLVGTKMGLNSAKYISPLLSHKNFHFSSLNLTKNQLGDEGVA